MTTMEQGKANRCLVLTGTIEPNAIYSVHADVSLRAAEYVKALEYYCSLFSGDIYFLENSAYDIWADERFAKLHHSGKVTIIRFQPSAEYNRGKGYQEFKMLEEFVVSYADRYTSFIKITGRYIVENFNKIRNEHCPGIVIDRFYRLKTALTSYFICDFEFYRQCCLGLYQEVNDLEGMYIEVILYRALKNTPPDKISFFASNTTFLGISGSTGKNLAEPAYKHLVRSLMRPIFKILHIKELL